MRKIALSVIAVAFACACAQTPVDRALCKGKTVKGLQTLIQFEEPAGFNGLTIRKVAFVNSTTRPLSIDAIETSRIELEGKEVWSFQPVSSGEREDWVLPVENGTSRRNYLGMNDEDYGGGIPMVCIWTPEKNLSAGVAEPVLKLVSMPLRRKGNHTEACIRQDFDNPKVLQPGDTLYSLQQFILEGPKGDFFEPLRTFTSYMEQNCGFRAPESPAEAFEPVWCAWGYERTFTVDEVIGTLPKVVELGFKWVDVDDGYQWCEGDWEANDRIGPDGMRRMTDAIHKAGLKAKLWWAPMAADPESHLAK